MVPHILASVTIFGIAVAFSMGKPANTKSPRKALQAFGDLIGTWNGTGTPVGSREDVQKNFWTEKMSWEWQFKDKDAWLKVAFEKSKNFAAGELRYVPGKDHFTLTLTDLKKRKSPTSALWRPGTRRRSSRWTASKTRQAIASSSVSFIPIASSTVMK